MASFIIPDPVNQNFINKVYPVGSIYMSVNSTSPATLFGVGEWERIQDRFLLGASNTYAAGNTGGAASQSYTPAGTNSGGAVSNHTLTTAEIPAHNHTFTGSAVNTGNQSAGHTHTYTDYYATTTGGTAITVANMPSHAHPAGGSGATGRYYLRNAASSLYGNSGGSTHHVEQWPWDKTVEPQGSTTAHTHSGANTSTTRTSNGISANHTHSVTAKGTIANTGSGNAHNHGFTQPTFKGTAATINTMPPYLAVYMWKRTA